MTGVEAASIIILAGALGGLVSSAMSESGFVLYKTVKSPDGQITWNLGLLGNVPVGGTAALVSWGLYGAYAAQPLIGGPDATPSWSALVAAVVTGIGGARWLSAEVDKIFLKKTAALAASAPGNSVLASDVLSQSPARAFESALRYSRSSLVGDGQPVPVAPKV